jgi:6-phosphofructokinase 1
VKRIAVLTSGGDAAGMNAAVRAVVRTGAARGLEVFGVRRGYAGLIAGDAAPLGVRDVGGIIQRGGTVLGTARCAEFTTDDGRAMALTRLRRLGVDALVVVVGNGSQTGAHLLSAQFPVVGVASTIDNDLVGSDITLGADTALNVALESIDRLKTTASSHGRAFVVETMGRKCGYIALMAGIAGGAECVVVPEIETTPEEVARAVRAAYDRGQAHAVVVVAEGARHDGDALAAYFRDHRERLGFELRVTKLGHVQRGGAPGAFDRLLGTRLGAGAVDAFVRGEHGVLVGLVRGVVATTPLADVAFRTKGVDPALFELARVLAT